MARVGESPPREAAATIVALQRFSDRTVAHRWAARKRPDRADRLVLACEACPQPQRSRRRPPAWGRFARDVADAFGLPAADVRQALAAAREADRKRRVVESTKP